jgi:AAA domain
MKLKLTNWKCFASAEYILSNSGITLLRGPSGCGKTSIYEAIVYAIYGTGTDVISYGKTSCLVMVEDIPSHMGPVSITRTKGPCSVSVCINGINGINGINDQIHKGDVAETILNKIWPLNVHAWDGQAKPFLTASSIDRMGILETLVNWGGTPIINIIKDEYNRSMEIRASAQARVAEASAAHRALGNVPNDPPYPGPVLAGPIPSIEECKYQIECAQKVVEPQMAKYSLEIAKYNSTRDAWLKSCHDHKSWEILQAKTKSINVEKTNNQLAYIEAIDALGSYPIPQDVQLECLTCPVCMASLSIDSNILVHVTEREEDVEDVEDGEPITKKPKMIKCNMEQYNMYKLKCAQRKEAQELVKRLKCDLESQTRHILVEKLSCVARAKATLEPIITPCPGEEPIRPSPVSHEQLAECLATQRLADASASRLNIWQETCLRYSIERERCNIKVKELEEARVNLNIAESNVQDYIQLVELCAEARGHVLNQMASCLSDMIEMNIETMFSNPPSLGLSMWRRNKTAGALRNDHVPQLHITYSMDGYDRKLSSFSGGQKARLELAATCAIATLANSSFILLDESMANLDQDASSLIIDHLKSLCMPVIITAHQVVSGPFDNIVDVRV